MLSIYIYIYYIYITEAFEDFTIFQVSTFFKYNIKTNLKKKKHKTDVTENSAT